MMRSKRFNIDVSEDENEIVEISLSTNQDFKIALPYDEIVKRLQDEFDKLKLNWNSFQLNSIGDVIRYFLPILIQGLYNVLTENGFLYVFNHKSVVS